MSSPKKQTAIAITNAAYVKAYMKRVNWSRVFPNRVVAYLNKFAVSINTTVDIVACMLLTNTAALLGPNTCLAVSDTFRMSPNLYMVIIAKPNLGKSPAFVELCSKPLQQLEQNIEKKIAIDDFTRAGLMSSLARMNGYGYICRDELCHTLVEMLKSSDGGSTFRSNLNTLFSGVPYSKDYVSRERLKLKKCLLSILGTTQQGPFVEFYQKMQELNDGLSDRFLCYSCPATPAPDGTYDNSNVSLANSWPIDLAKSIYDDHNEDPLEYTLSADAKEFYNSVKKACDEEEIEYYKNFETMVASSSSAISTTDVPNGMGASKDHDLCLKLALAIHVTSHKLTALIDTATQGAAVDTQTPRVISIETFKTALSLVQGIRSQETEYKSAYTALQGKVDCSNSSEVTESFLNTSSETSMLREILMYPGKVVTSTMVTRRKRLKADLVITGMDQLSSNPETKVFGVYKKIVNQHVYFKAPVESIADEMFSQFVSKLEYAAAYNADMTRPPCKMNVHSWREYYENLLSQAPNFL